MSTPPRPLNARRAAVGGPAPALAAFRTSLDAWPGEAARPPLRLLEAPRLAPRALTAPAAARPAVAGWLQRLRQVLRAG